MLSTFYEQSAARDPKAGFDYTFDQWLRFLETHGLVTRKDDLIAITIDGREFLKYILDRGYSLHRRG